MLKPDYRFVLRSNESFSVFLRHWAIYKAVKKARKRAYKVIKTLKAKNLN